MLQSAEELGLSNESVIVILKALGCIISHQPADKYESLMSNVVALQVKPLHEVTPYCVVSGSIYATLCSNLYFGPVDNSAAILYLVSIIYDKLVCRSVE